MSPQVSIDVAAIAVSPSELLPADWTQTAAPYGVHAAMLEQLDHVGVIGAALRHLTFVRTAACQVNS